MKTEEHEHHKEHHHEYKYTVDHKEPVHETREHHITGAEIRKVGKIPHDYKIYLKERGPGDDRLIEDHEKVELSKHHIDHFYGCKPNTTNG
jgi:hypothetical protein